MEVVGDHQRYVRANLFPHAPHCLLVSLRNVLGDHRPVKRQINTIEASTRRQIVEQRSNQRFIGLSL